MGSLNCTVGSPCDFLAQPMNMGICNCLQTNSLKLYFVRLEEEDWGYIMNRSIMVELEVIAYV